MAKPRISAGKRPRRAKRMARRRSPTPHPRAIEATLADVAHEIRTPLTGILALGELLATSELGARERGWATAIKSTAEHLALLTSLIVDAARAGAKGLVLRRELIRPRRLADALAASLAGRAEAKGLEHTADISAALPQAVIGDALRLRAALENLIDNAVKFTEHGSVRLGVTCERAARGKARLIFTVTDSGIGLTAAEIKRLFRPFAQASEQVARNYGGAGLGLTFVKRIAKAMGGDLAVTSEPGRGSRFRMSVTVDKVAEAATAPSEGAAARRPLRRGQSLRSRPAQYPPRRTRPPRGFRRQRCGGGRGSGAGTLRRRVDGRDATGFRRRRSDAAHPCASRSQRPRADRRRVRPRQCRRRGRRPRRGDGRLSHQAAEPERAHAAARIRGGANDEMTSRQRVSSGRRPGPTPIDN